MRSIGKIGAIALLCLGVSVAKGTLIEFFSAPSPLPPSYFEGGYTITSSGGWTGGAGITYGADLAGANATGTLQIQQVPGWVPSDTGVFFFNGVYIGGPANYGVGYQITGYLNGNTVFSLSGEVPGYPGSVGGQVYGSPYAPIDTLDITVQNYGFSNYSFVNVDDINVGVPDSASTVGLLGVALVPLIALGVRQRRQSPLPE